MVFLRCKKDETSFSLRGFDFNLQINSGTWRGIQLLPASFPFQIAYVSEAIHSNVVKMCLALYLSRANGSFRRMICIGQRLGGAKPIYTSSSYI